MSAYNCYYYCYDNPFGGSGYFSGTTCDGLTGAFTLNYGECICVDVDFSFNTCGNLTYSGSCDPIFITPTNTPTVTQTPTPTNTPAACREYYAEKLSTFLSVSDINWTDCNGVPQSQTLENPPSTYPENITFCALAGSLSYDSNQISVVDNGFCILTTPTPTPTNTSSPTNTQTASPTNTPTNTATPTTTTTQTQTPTPSVTIGLTPTMTASPTVTPTNTPSNTTTNTPTPSVTPTNTNTPTNTATKTSTPTPTSTMNPLCPEQLNYTTTFTGMTGADGTYQRLYSYSGGSFNYGYQTGTTFFVGNSFVVFGKNDGTNFFEIIALYSSLTGLFVFYTIQRSTGNYRFNGGTFITSNNIGNASSFETIAGSNIPKRGVYVSGSNTQTISYPEVCPTATPTASVTNTVTPTNTSTPTNTPTNTQTKTPTPTQTPTSTPPSCNAQVVVDNNSTTGGLEITSVDVNGTNVTYDSGDNFPVGAGELGNFLTSVTGVSTTLSVYYSSHTGSKAINLVDCDGNVFCCDGLNTAGGSCSFEGIAIDCTCSSGIQITINDGACI